MNVARILELLGDEVINMETVITSGKGLTIEQFDIFEIDLDPREGCTTTVGQIIQLMLEGQIVGSTSLKFTNEDNVQEDEISEDYIKLFPME